MPTDRVRLIDSLSITHAAWDVPAVHGVHAMYSVSKVGTARAELAMPHSRRDYAAQVR